MKNSKGARRTLFRYGIAAMVALAGYLLLQNWSQKEYFEALHRDDVGRVGRVLRIAPWLVRSRDHYGDTGLHIAVEKSSQRMIDILARNGADVNASSPRLGGLLHSAAFYGDIATVDKLLEFGADIHKQHVSMSHGSVLHSACAGGHLDVVTLLLRKGADVNLRIPSIDKKRGGYTPFLMTMPLNHCRSSGIEVCQILLSAGADPVAKSDAGETLLDIVERAPEATNPFRAEQILFLSKVFKERDEAHRGE